MYKKRCFIDKMYFQKKFGANIFEITLSEVKTFFHDLEELRFSENYNFCQKTLMIELNVQMKRS